MLPTPTNIVMVPEYLQAFEAAHDNGLELTISKSKHVRPTDKTFEPVRERLDGRCLKVLDHFEFPDRDMAFGVNQFYAVMAFDECPAEEHLCINFTRPVDDIFRQKERHDVGR